jgi:predicted ribosome quality control (RQC) complex YloA/Tae2 family protein
MKITLKITKSLHESAAEYYEKAKQARKKTHGIEKAIEETKAELQKAEKDEEEKKKQVKVKKEKKWYEKFHWFYTSEGKLAIGGKDAQQNDLLFARHLEDDDLFFHADIQGASAVILKEGIAAAWDELLEAAQLAASFSNAWKNGNASVDVYAVRKEQLSKHVSGGYVAKGGFAITGERKWFRTMKLGLRIGIENGEAIILPEIHKKKLEKEILLYPARGGKEKGELAKTIAKRLSVHVDSVMQILPSGATKAK